MSCHIASSPPPVIPRCRVLRFSRRRNEKWNRRTRRFRGQIHITECNTAVLNDRITIRRRGRLLRRFSPRLLKISSFPQKWKGYRDCSLSTDGVALILLYFQIRRHSCCVPSFRLRELPILRIELNFQLRRTSDCSRMPRVRVKILKRGFEIYFNDFSFLVTKYYSFDITEYLSCSISEL